MSWMGDFTPGGETSKDAPPPQSEVENTETVQGAFGKPVAAKKANQPFLKYQELRKKQEEELEAKKQRNKERLERQARGEEVEPPEKEEINETVNITLWDIIKFLFIVTMIVLGSGYFITGDPLWDYQGKWRRLSSYLPKHEMLFTETGLAKFDGSDPTKPLYLAIDSNVYDVTPGRRTYGPGGSYAFMAGKDAARAFATGCFKEHQTHDLRGLDEDEQRGIDHWKKFFANHKDYRKVGRVVHPPIDPASPIPEHCNPDTKQKRAENRQKRKQEEMKDKRQEL
ncbi:hypothetical protein Clacol_001919 [Clathrus columnatus]|uniref:Cytochrome b5 heme-binding domain-containing protein n=1 Tax=Clathrus columnatus TaxID=1419009 RepID=A0AAV5A369_9AGAM|nr:hypothetical protein Clacol_001919 [Clathrus columnatus]